MADLHVLEFPDNEPTELQRAAARATQHQDFVLIASLPEGTYWKANESCSLSALLFLLKVVEADIIARLGASGDIE